MTQAHEHSHDHTHAHSHEAPQEGGPVIVLTEKALAEVGRLLQAEKLAETHFLRIKVVGGGCSGLSYQLAFDNQSQAGDVTYPQAGGFKVVVDPQSKQYLHGTVLDYLDTFGGGGFTFRNPNAKSTCGCGSSFSA